MRAPRLSTFTFEPKVLTFSASRLRRNFLTARRCGLAAQQAIVAQHRRSPLERAVTCACYFLEDKVAVAMRSARGEIRAIPVRLFDLRPACSAPHAATTSWSRAHCYAKVMNSDIL
jgi:hypothetical protein